MILHLAATLALLVASALLLRWQVGAWRARPPAWVLALDLAPLLIGAALFAALSARPLVGALVVAALAAGLALADAVKRQVLNEPVVFADRAELLEVVRHPEFYLPFAGTAIVLAGAGAALALAAGLIWLVPPLWSWSPWPVLAAVALAVAALALPGWPPLLARLRRRYETLPVSRDPARDAASFGQLATFALHATIARAERPARLAAPSVLRQSRGGATRGPVVMAQLESFFDPRRLHPAIPANLLPGWDRCRAEAVAAGRLAVPCWGANTIRTEFSALTGLGGEQLGLDRFNPYERFARHRVDSLAWRMRGMGRRTICLHPFDKRFYGRDHAIPALGFERFIGPEAFDASQRRSGPVSDADLACKAAEILAESGPDVFLFVISIGNHGPWQADRGARDKDELPEPLRGLPEAADLRRYLGGLRRTDRFFPIMTGALLGLGTDGLLLAYGDHQPSLPGALAALGAGDTDTDYALWDSRMKGNPTVEAVPVEALAGLLLDRVAPPRVAAPVMAELVA